MSARQCIALAAGGTGGHVFPAKALAEELTQRGFRVVWITDQRGAPLGENFPCTAKLILHAKSPNKRNPVQFLHALWLLGKAVFASKKFLKTHQCTQIVGFGGYPSLPSLFAARRLSLPILLHEQNAVLGRSNRMFAGYAKWIASGFDDLSRLPPAAKVRHVVTGNPLRLSIIEHGETPYPDPHTNIHIFLLGGSLGARLLSQVFPAAIALLPPDLRKKIRITAQITPDEIKNAAHVFADANVPAALAPFFDDVAARLSKTHLVVARAGASSVSEFAAMGIPSILIPLKMAMDDHQSGNAKTLENVGAADILCEDILSPQILASLIQARISAPDDLIRRANLAKTICKPNAAKALADLVQETGQT